MTPWLLMRVALHLAGKEFLIVPGNFWVTFAADGEEIPGISREPTMCADPEVLTESAVQWANAEDIAFTNTPDAEVDEVWVFDESVGGNLWYSIPMAVTLVDGGAKTFRAGALAHIIETH